MSLLTIEFDAPAAPDAVGIATEVSSPEGVRVWLGATTLNGPTQITVPPGTYVVRARLPSGADATGQVTVEERATVVLRYARDDAPAVPVYYLKPAPHKAEGRLGPGDLRLWTRNVARAGHEPADIYRVREAWKGEEIPLRPGSYAERCDVRYVDPSAESGVFAELRFWEPPGRRTQTWLQVRSQLFAIPAGTAATDAIVEPAGGDRFLVSVHNLHADADALLSYLSAGDFVSARAVSVRLVDLDTGLQRAHELLRTFASANSSAAAIAGYFIIRAAAVERLSESQRRRIGTWARALATSFPALPDGALIFGWDALTGGDVDLALTAFVEACRRGIPMYTMGLRYLIDGLRMATSSERARFASSADAIRALEWLTQYAGLADWGAQTTSLAIDRPFEPFETRSIAVFPASPVSGQDTEGSLSHQSVYSFDVQRSRLAELTARPLLLALEPATSWRVMLAKSAMRRILEQQSEGFNVGLLEALSEIEEDPLRFPRITVSVRAAYFTDTRLEWRLAFAVDAAGYTIFVVSIDPVVKGGRPSQWIVPPLSERQLAGRR